MVNETAVVMFVPEIEGASTLRGFNPELGEDKDHRGWIPIDSCTFKFARDDTVSDASEDDEESEGPTTLTKVEPIEVKRSADNSTAPFLMWLANKDQDERKKEKVLIDYCLPSGRYFLRYELAGVELVSSSLQYSGGEGRGADEDVDESLTFTFDAVRIMQRPIDVNGEVDVGGETVAEYVVFEPE